MCAINKSSHDNTCVTWQNKPMMYEMVAKYLVMGMLRVFAWVDQGQLSQLKTSYLVCINRTETTKS